MPVPLGGAGAKSNARWDYIVEVDTTSQHSTRRLGSGSSGRIGLNSRLRHLPRVDP